MPIQSQLTAWLLRRTATAGVRRVASLAAAIATEIGSVRDENQDRAVLARGRDRQGQDYAVAVVADGIGGMRDGATCAAMAIGSFIASVHQHAQFGSDNSEAWLRRAVNDSNEAVFASLRGNGGSTLVALLLRPGHTAFWLSVGDSRVYRSTGKSLVQISIDDTIAGQLGRNSETAFEQSKLLQFIGMGGELEPHINELVGAPADTVVLTTDGVHYLAPANGWLGQIVGNAPDPGICVKRLVDLAKWCGGPDNATAVMIALSAEREVEVGRPYSCLEVWDTFGELQIILNENARERTAATHRNEGPVADRPSFVALNALIGSPELVDGRPKKAERDASKTRRSKRTQRKAKSANGKRDKSSLKSTDVGVPQLLMEFPTKSK